MFCLFCKHHDTEVIETRISEDGKTVRRRRMCLGCSKRFTTYERVEELPLLVIKRDGRRERFDREKLKLGIVKAVGKTTITAKQIEEIVSEIESELTNQEAAAEISSERIGTMVAQRLRKFDKVAYIRFASVFRRFVEVEEFEREIQELLEGKKAVH